MKREQWFIRGLVCGVPFLVVAFGFGALVGRSAEEKFQSDYCCEGATRSCVFGPGIVGVQRCSFKWSLATCEPDPRYRVPQESR